MKKYLPFLLLAQTAVASYEEYDYVRYYAYYNDSYVLNSFLEEGGNIDAVNADGLTPLCAAVFDGDYEAYDLLVKLGADPHHKCTKLIPSDVKQSFNETLSFHQMKTTPLSISSGSMTGLSVLGWGGLLGAAGAGIAMAAGGGGGGSSHHAVVSPTEPEPPVIPSEPTEPTEADKKVFETGEYHKGGFLPFIHASGAYARGFTGKGVVVAVEDNSAVKTHKDLAPNMSAIKELNSKRPTYVDEDQLVDDSHGMYVAGVIGAVKNGKGMHGVAPDAKIVATAWNGAQPRLKESSDFFISHHARVVNMSFALEDDTGDPKDNYADRANDPNPHNHAYSNFEYILGGDPIDALKNYQKHKVVMVVAAGNESQNHPSLLAGAPLTPTFGKGTKYDLSNLMLSVVSVDNMNQISSFSNRCGVSKEYCIAAPGEHISSTIEFESPKNPQPNGYVTTDGTSLAAPVVTGSLAVMMEAFPYLSSPDIVRILLDTATDLGEPGVDEIYGHGLVNLDKATAPVGTTTLTTSLTGNRVVSHSSSMRISSALGGSIVEKLPKFITVMDDYQRMFPVSSDILLDSPKIHSFQKDFSRFVKQSHEKDVKLSDKFAFKTAVAGNQPDAFSFTYQSDKSKTQVYYLNSATEEVTGLVHPFKSQENTYGFLHTASLSPKWALSFTTETGKNGFQQFKEDESEDRGDVYSFSGKTTYRALENASVSFEFGRFYEDDSLLGFVGKGAFETKSSYTDFFGTSLHMKPSSDVTIMGSLHYGRSAVESETEFLRLSDVQSFGFALEGTYQLSSSDQIKAVFSSPLSAIKGKAFLNLPVGRTEDKVLLQKTALSLASPVREYDAFMYHERVRDGWQFKTGAGFRLNPDNTRDDPDFRIMFSVGGDF